jgi:hypothetical protein
VLHEQLARWTAAGLIDKEQAGRIEAAEVPAAAASPVRAAGTPHRRLPLVVEALGYLGAVLAIAAGASVVMHFWHNVPASAELTFAGVVALGLLAAGAVLRTGEEPALGRLRSVLWLLSTLGAASFVALLADQVWHLSGTTVALLAEGAGTIYAIPLWWRTRSALQHLTVFAGIAALVATGIGQIASGTSAWGPGLGIWSVAALWGIAVHRGYLVPQTAGLAAAGVGLLVGAEWTMFATAAGHALAVGTVAILLAVGVALRRVLLLGLGAVAAVITLPETADRYLPHSAAAALSVCAVGLILLGIALWLAKTRRTT